MPATMRTRETRDIITDTDLLDDIDPAACEGDMELTPSLWTEHIRRNDRENEDKRRLLRLIVFGSSFSSLFAIAVVLPFFQEFTFKHLGLGNKAIGLILSAAPAAQIISSVLWTTLQSSPRVGRQACLILGLAMLSAGGILFASSRSVVAFVASRAMMGAGVQGADTAGAALLMQVADSSRALSRDIGYLELVLGVGFMLGPAFGGLVYDEFGFNVAAASGASFPLVMALLALCLLGCCPISARGQETIGPENVLDASETWQVVHANSEDEGQSARLVVEELVGSGTRDEARAQTGATWHRSISWSAASGCVAVTAQSIGSTCLSMTLGHHLGLTLGTLVPRACARTHEHARPPLRAHTHTHTHTGVNKSEVGAIFMLVPASYCLSCWLFACQAESESAGWGGIGVESPKRLMVSGLVLNAVGFLLVSAQGMPRLSWRQGVTFESMHDATAVWVTNVVALILYGASSALVHVPFVPFALASFRCSPGGRGEARRGDALEDMVASCRQVMWSLGELAGPILGGWLLERSPPTFEPGCRKGPAECCWGFHYTMQVTRAPAP